MQVTGRLKFDLIFTGSNFTTDSRIHLHAGAGENSIIATEQPTQATTSS
jgi:hypothetical protein